MHSDPAGNALSQSFAFLTTVALWLFLAARLIAARMKGGMPRWASVAAFVLVPASGAAAVGAVSLLTDLFYNSKWPAVVPALAPPLIIAAALWAFVPDLGGFISTSYANAFTWSAAMVYRNLHREADRAKAAVVHIANEPKNGELLV